MEVGVTAGVTRKLKRGGVIPAWEKSPGKIQIQRAQVGLHTKSKKKKKHNHRGKAELCWRASYPIWRVPLRLLETLIWLPILVR